MGDNNELIDFDTDPVENESAGLHDELTDSISAAEAAPDSMTTTEAAPSHILETEAAPGRIERHRDRSRNRLLAWAMTGSILLSGVMGFGGGYLAFKVGQSNTPAATTTIVTAAANAATQTAAASRIQTIAATSGQSTALSLPQIAAKTMPSVVEINTEVLVSSQRTQQYVAEGAGSGVIISADGYIVTNNHVIEDTQKITVRLTTGVTYDATLVGTDTQKDIAVLKIDATGLTPATLGSSSGLLVGDLAVAIGNPLGELGGTVTDGIISALDREITLDGQSMNLLQTNASINPGNSGGGLFDDQGNLIGIVVAKSSGTSVEGLGFAIPIDDARPVIEELMNFGYVRGRISLGLTLVDVTSQQSALAYRVSTLGVYVSQVSASGSAASAGFSSGDRIVSVDGTAVSSIADLNKIIEAHKVGDTISVIVQRSRQQVTLSMTLQESKPTGA